MLKNGVVTLFALSPDGEDYKRCGTYPAWIHCKKRLRSTEKGIYFRDNFDVRIERKLIKCISVGDLIYFGDMGQDEFSVAECRRVAVVAENNFGSTPHWHLQAEYEYR